MAHVRWDWYYTKDANKSTQFSALASPKTDKEIVLTVKNVTKFMFKIFAFNYTVSL